MPVYLREPDKEEVLQNNDIALTHKWASRNSLLKRRPNTEDPKEPCKDFDKGWNLR